MSMTLYLAMTLKLRQGNLGPDSYLRIILRNRSLDQLSTSKIQHRIRIWRVVLLHVLATRERKVLKDIAHN